MGLRDFSDFFRTKANKKYQYVERKTKLNRRSNTRVSVAVLGFVGAHLVIRNCIE